MCYNLYTLQLRGHGALPIHETSESHKATAMNALAFKDICAGKVKDIHSHISKEYEEQVK